MVLPAGLVLLAAPVVVDGEDPGTPQPRRGGEEQRRPAGVAADLQERAGDIHGRGRLVQREPFIGRQEAGGRLGGRAQQRVHPVDLTVGTRYATARLVRQRQYAAFR